MKDKLNNIWRKLKRPLFIASFLFNALFSVLLVYSCAITPKEEKTTLKTAKNRAYIPNDTSFWGFDLSTFDFDIDRFPNEFTTLTFTTDNLSIYLYGENDSIFYKPSTANLKISYFYSSTTNTGLFGIYLESTPVQGYTSSDNWVPQTDVLSIQFCTLDGSNLDSDLLGLFSSFFSSDLQVVDLNNWNPNVVFKQNTFVFHKSNLTSQSDITYEILQNSYFVFNNKPYTSIYTTYYTTAHAFMLYGAGVPWNQEIDGYHGVIYDDDYTFPVQVGFTNRYPDVYPISGVMLTDVKYVATSSGSPNAYVENNSLNVLVKGLDKIYVPSVILKANNRINTALSNQDVLTANRDYISNVTPYGQDVLYGDVFGLIGSSFTGLLGFMNIALVPGITIGVLLFIPLVGVIVFAIIRIIKK